MEDLVDLDDIEEIIKSIKEDDFKDKKEIIDQYITTLKDLLPKRNIKDKIRINNFVSELERLNSTVTGSKPDTKPAPKPVLPVLAPKPVLPVPVPKPSSHTDTELNRLINAQKEVFKNIIRSIEEVGVDKYIKRDHWIWYVFPTDRIGRFDARRTHVPGNNYKRLTHLQEHDVLDNWIKILNLLNIAIQTQTFKTVFPNELDRGRIGIFCENIQKDLPPELNEVVREFCIAVADGSKSSAGGSKSSAGGSKLVAGSSNPTDYYGPPVDTPLGFVGFQWFNNNCFLAVVIQMFMSLNLDLDVIKHALRLSKDFHLRHNTGDPIEVLTKFGEKIPSLDSIQLFSLEVFGGYKIPVYIWDNISGPIALFSFIRQKEHKTYDKTQIKIERVSPNNLYVLTSFILCTKTDTGANHYIIFSTADGKNWYRVDGNRFRKVTNIDAILDLPVVKERIVLYSYRSIPKPRPNYSSLEGTEVGIRSYSGKIFVF